MMHFFGLRPFSSHGLKMNYQFSPTAFVVWKPLGIRQTDRRPPDKFSAQCAQFFGALFGTKTPSGFDVIKTLAFKGQGQRMSINESPIG